MLFWGKYCQGLSNEIRWQYSWFQPLKVVDYQRFGLTAWGI
jgi:hypothetical protein